MNGRRWECEREREEERQEIEQESLQVIFFGSRTLISHNQQQLYLNCLTAQFHFIHRHTLYGAMMYVYTNRHRLLFHSFEVHCMVLPRCEKFLIRTRPNSIYLLLCFWRVQKTLNYVQCLFRVALKRNLKFRTSAWHKHSIVAAQHIVWVEFKNEE